MVEVGLLETGSTFYQLCYTKIMLFIIPLFIAVCFILYVVAAAFILWMLVDAAKQDNFWWLVIILGIPIIGAIMYYFLEKKRDYVKVAAA